MQVFANGHLARLTWDTIFPWFIEGGAHDAPRGQMGPVSVQFDVWFQLDDRGALVPAAVWQVTNGPENL